MVEQVVSIYASDPYHDIIPNMWFMTLYQLLYLHCLH